jgi:uncharacterized BrkB/YihY/UPF0761 family membrane protein
VKLVRSLLATLDAWQRRHPVPGVLFGVQKKFGTDRLNLYVVGLGWYGFLSVYPLLLVIITVLGFIGVASLGTSLVATLHQFPVVGSQFNPEHSSLLHGSVVGLVVGLVALTYGAQGVTQTAQAAMAAAWNIPHVTMPGFLPRLGRSLWALAIIGATFVANGALASFATGTGHSGLIRTVALLAMLVVNVLGYLGAFRSLTPKGIGTRPLVPGALVGALGFTVLITAGSGLIQHQLRHSSSTYGQFGAVIGLVGFLLLLAKISLYGAELNVVLARHLWPRALVGDNPTEADDEALRSATHQTQGRNDQVISVAFDVRRPAPTTEEADQLGPPLP